MGTPHRSNWGSSEEGEKATGAGHGTETEIEIGTDMGFPVEDPFEDPTPRQAKHASADSFRGRLIAIEPVSVERDVPKQAKQPNGAKGDKITANVILLDGLGPVKAYSQRVATGAILEGPVYRKVWFNQDQVTEACQTPDGKSLRKLVLCRIDTLKPGLMAGQGNPWVVTPATPEERQQAIQAYAAIMMGGAQQAAPAAPVADENPFAPKAPF